MSAWDAALAALAALEDPWDAALRALPYERADRPGLLFTDSQHQLWDDRDRLAARTDDKRNYFRRRAGLPVGRD